MYSLSDIRTVLKNPKWFAREANRLYAHRLGFHDHYTEGIEVFAEDWDNLVILDACRYDEFKRVCDLPGALQKVRSRGATSSEFVRGNFRGRTLHDVVYVSANAYYAYLRDKIEAEVHALVGLHGDEMRDAGNGLTTHPETVTEHALGAHDSYPNKRLVVHYFQPHQPYLGPYGRERFNPGRGLPHVVNASDPTREELLRAYRENLEIVLKEVEILLAELPGKTVVTSDHGEMFGERMWPVPVIDYGHHDGVHIDELLEVPWFVSENSSRKEVVSEPPVESEDLNFDKLESQLRALGYQE